MTTRQIAEELLSRIASRDPGAAAELFGDGVDFSCAGSPAAPWIRPRRTRQDMADFFDAMNAHFIADDTSASLSAFVVDGADAVVMGHVSQRLRSNGNAFTTPFALHLTVGPDGLIIGYHVYEDSLTVAEAIGAP